MGCRGNVRTVNKIEYGASSYSDFYILCNLIYYYQNEKNPDMYVDLETEEWEFEEEIWEELVNYFNNLSQEEKEKISKKLNISLEDLNNAIEDFNGWLEDGKKAETGWITIDWF